MKLISHNCIFCKKEINKNRIDGFEGGEDWEGSFDGGIVDRIDAGYGSLLDGDMFLIAICDECINEKVLIGDIKYIGNYILPETKEYTPLKKDK